MNGITYARGDATAQNTFGLGAARCVQVEPLVVRRLVERGIPVTVYDFGA
ncbi:MULTISPECIES: hypothetical protein [unclassified Streptomyces]